MKKYHVLAMVGTLALLVNLLVPGVAFGQVEGQTGTATLGCSLVDPAFSITPDDFAFTDSTGTGLISKTGDQWAYKDADAAGGNLNPEIAGTTDFIDVVDVQDPSLAECNNGITVDVMAKTDFLGAISPNEIPLADTYVLSSAEACPAAYGANTTLTATDGTSKLCFDNADGEVALCGNGDGVAADHSACAGGTWTADATYTGTAWNTSAPFTSAGWDLDPSGTAGAVLMDFDDDNELFGTAGLATSFATLIPGGTPGDTYTLDLEYTLTKKA